MKFDVIGAVEACYVSAADDQAWLDGILDKLSPIDQGFGLYAQTFRWAPDGAWILELSVVNGVFPTEVLSEVERRNSGMPQELLRRIYAPGLKHNLLDRAPELRERGADIFRETGIADMLGIVATEPGGESVIAALPLSPSSQARGSCLPPRTMHQLTCLSAHLGSSLRLRRALRDALEGGGRAAPDAVLDPRGRTLDAVGAAKERGGRESLAQAVRRMERARGRLRRTAPEEALTLWQGLVAGTWSLVDRCEADGKRYLLARRNEPGVQDPAALTRHERAVLAFAAMGHPNKFIAYLLGLPSSTVSRRLGAAQRKLKIESRSELIRSFAPLVQPQRDPPA